MAAEFATCKQAGARIDRRGRGLELTRQLLVLLGVGLFSTALAHAQAASEAQPGQAHPSSNREISIFKEAAEPLGLNEEQIARLEAISRESSAYATEIRAELRATRSDLHALLGQDEPDLVAVMALADEIGVQETRMRKHQLVTLLSMRALLSREQRENLMPVFREIGDRKRAGAVKAKAPDATNPASPPTTARATTQP